MKSWRLVLLVLGWTAAMALGRSPNVIIFLADDMGNGDVACYGATDIKTPNIDSLAATGMRFTSYYAPAPICSPSRAAMITGRYPLRAGISTRKNIGSDLDSPGVPTREITVAELAKTRGYATAVFGKWHLGAIPECRPSAQGFDLFFGHFASCLDSFSHMYYASEPWHYDLYRNNEEVYEDGVHVTDLITRETLKFIDANRETPFFIYVAYNTPHYPMVSRSRFVKEYSHLSKSRQVWAAAVAGLDESIGQIVGRLTERKLLGDTLMFFASDNGAPDPSGRGEGGGSNAPYREYKRSLFEGGIRLPGIVSFKGTVPAGVVCDQPVIGMDIFATAAQAMGADLPKDRTIDGKSWFPLFKEPTQPVHEALFFEWELQHAVRMGPWKLVQNGITGLRSAGTTKAAGDNAIYLSDVTTDLGEKTNVRSLHEDQAEKMCRMHEQWLKSIAADPTASPDVLKIAKPPGGEKKTNWRAE